MVISGKKPLFDLCVKDGGVVCCTCGAVIHGCVWLFVCGQGLVEFVPFFKILTFEWFKVF